MTPNTISCSSKMSVSIELVLMQTKHCTSATGSFRIIFWLLNRIESTGVDPISPLYSAT
ncbi:hypothetical protein GYMLUDRAFT_560655 [Collybiopsis luxurians FD-317 M1]|uniref:Uncharacterized protein n=1 Tax=Collybiopsis luxurians FD-317 M1 TaxID=944289 RepID=A0A0D0C1J7_9AGAR|nr:hypothetical protein GYMLUDRAFT_560655 [Collybiopsis luxurians FD-317 M1]